MVHPDILKHLDFFRGLSRPALQQIAEHAEIREYENNTILCTQHDRAIALFLLVSGTVQFLIRVAGGDDLLVGVGRDPGLLIGWSLFRAPYRYTTTVRCEQECRFLRVPAHVFAEIMDKDKETGVQLLRRVSEAIAQRLEFERDMLLESATRSHPPQSPTVESGHALLKAPQPKPQWDLSVPSGIREFLAHSLFFEDMDERYLVWLSDQAFVKSVAPGETLFTQGRIAEFIYLIVDGSLGLSYTDTSRGTSTRLRTIDGAGEPIGWSALVDPRRYRVTCVASAPSCLLALPSIALERLCEDEPDFGIALFRRLLQVIGSRLRSIRVRLVARRYSKETLAVRAMLDQAAESLHVSSALHKLPYLLENRLTLTDAFHVLELTKHHGDALERNLASFCLDLLEDVHKELDFYRGLQAAYEAVANAPGDRSAADVRKRCMEVFIQVFRTTSYRIRGEDNLPKNSGNIVIMNHLENHPDTQLPNDFRLTLDTHFVSSMILYPRYGFAPIRIIRKPPLGWFGHQQYFDRLEYIYVYAGDQNEEDRDQQVTHDDRTRSFLHKAANHIHAGRNVVIAPEGTCRHTEDSPAPFRLGAFHLAASIRPEPLIVPIAVANFDKKITHTTTAAIIYPPFRLSERVRDPGDEDCLVSFVEELHDQYKGYVREAVELSRT